MRFTDTHPIKLSTQDLLDLGEGIIEEASGSSDASQTLAKARSKLEIYLLVVQRAVITTHHKDIRVLIDRLQEALRIKNGKRTAVWNTGIQKAYERLRIQEEMYAGAPPPATIPNT